MKNLYLITTNNLKGVKSGFKWTSPTRNGMICFTFDKCGVYYYSDISGNEAASYIGIIAVKKKPEHHIVNFNEETQKFDQGAFFN